MKKGLLFACFLLLASLFSASLFAQNAYLPDFTTGVLKVVNIATNTVVDNIAIGTGGNSVAVSPDGSRVYVGYYDDGTNSNLITVINAADHSVVKNILVNNEVPYVDGITISPDGSKLFFANLDTLYALNTQTLQIAAAYGVGTNELLEGVAVSPDGSTVYAAGLDNIYVMNATTYAIGTSIPINTLGLYQLMVSPNGKVLYATDIVDGGLVYIDIANKKSTTFNDQKELYTSVVPSHDGNTLYATTTDSNTVSVINIGTNEVTKVIPVGGFPWGISISADGSQVYACNVDDGSLSVISTASNTVTATINAGAECYALGGFASSANVLPVSLLNFTASLAGKDAKLQWTTANETNTSYFNIERSLDGIHFGTVGKITASGTSTAAKSYTYNDLNIAALVNAKAVYYRLQTVDKNGASSVSDIKTVTLNGKALMVLLLPNPVKSRLTIQVSNYSGKANISVTDMNGRRVIAQSRTLAEGANLSFDVSAFASGTYVLRVEGENLSLQQKFIKE